MNREIVEKIYHKSVDEAVEKAFDENETTAWTWEENMVKNTILELKYALAINHHALSLDQRVIINDTFGKIL